LWTTILGRSFQPGGYVYCFTIRIYGNRSILICPENIDYGGCITIKDSGMRVTENIIFAGADYCKTAGNGADEIHGTGMDGAVMRNEKKIAFQVLPGPDQKSFNTGGNITCYKKALHRSNLPAQF
jgi:hypothetical protein